MQELARYICIYNEQIDIHLIFKGDKHVIYIILFSVYIPVLNYIYFCFLTSEIGQVYIFVSKIFLLPRVQQMSQ